LPEVALLGRSNVGKSSLINVLARRRSLAKTSAHPGKTTTFNLYCVDHDFVVVDAPGLGYARTSRSERDRWERELALYVRKRERLAVVLMLMDSRHAPTEVDRDTMRFVHDSGRPALIVLTKSDKLSGNARTKALSRVANAMNALAVEWPVVETSAKTGRGREELLEWVDRFVSSI